MNGIFRSLTLSAFVLTAAHAFAKAPTWTKDCREAGEKATQECKEIHDQAKAGENADAANTLASMPKDGKGVNPEAQGLRQAALNQASRLTQAQQQCQEKQNECKQKCDEEENDRKPHQGKSAGPPDYDPMGPPATAQSGSVEAAKNGACIAPIAAMMADLGKGASDAANAANQAGNTGNQSGGMPPIPPIPPPSPKDQPTPPPTPTPTPIADQYGCTSDPNAPTLAKCTNDMVKKCTPGLASNAQNDPSCETFTMRYCNANSAGSTPFPTATDPSSGQSRPGAGVGTPYCNTAIAKNFCQEPGRSQCATCQNYRNQFSDTCKQNPASCAPTQFSGQCPDAEPPIATTPPSGTTPTAGGGDLMGGGGGHDTFGALPASAQAAKQEGVAPGSSGPNIDLAVSEGGGGAGFDSSSYDSFASKFRPKSSLATKARPPATSTGRDPASEAGLGGASGLSLFGITSAQIQKMCGRSQLHCGSPGIRN